MLQLSNFVFETFPFTYFLAFLFLSLKESRWHILNDSRQREESFPINLTFIASLFCLKAESFYFLLLAERGLVGVSFLNWILSCLKKSGVEIDSDLSFFLAIISN